MNLNGDLTVTMSSTSHVLSQKNKDDSCISFIMIYMLKEYRETETS